MIDTQKKYLITGGTGFLGDRLIARLSEIGAKNLVVVARNEGKLIALKEKYPFVEIIPGDIADRAIANKACHGVAGIFHLAAFKHVPLAEKHAWECIRSNVTGTMNLMLHSVGMDFFVFISTDKAAQVSGVYGATKFLGEKIVNEFSALAPQTKYLTIRYGNVFGSTGSFIYKWKAAIKEGREITLTDPAATRFFFTADSAVNLIFKAISEGNTGLFMPEMKAVSMGTIVDACHEVFGAFPVKLIGLQPGENLHETIDGKTFSNEVPQYTKEEFAAEFLGAVHAV